MKIWGGGGAIMFKMGKFCRFYQTFLEFEYKLGRQFVLDNLYMVKNKYWVWITILDLCLYMRC